MQMKPYQTAWDVALYMKKYWKSKPINIDAVAEYFLAGAKRELEKMNTEDTKAWLKEFDTWLDCWQIWIFS